MKTIQIEHDENMKRARRGHAVSEEQEYRIGTCKVEQQIVDREHIEFGISVFIPLRVGKPAGQWQVSDMHGYASMRDSQTQ